MDITREDQNKEYRQSCTYSFLFFCPQKEPQSKGYLYNTRADNDKVYKAFWPLQIAGDNQGEFVFGKAQVADTRVE